MITKHEGIEIIMFLCPFILTKMQKHNKIKHVNDINVHKYHKQQRRKNKNG